MPDPYASAVGVNTFAGPLLALDHLGGATSDHRSQQRQQANAARAAAKASELQARRQAAADKHRAAVLARSAAQAQRQQAAAQAQQARYASTHQLAGASVDSAAAIDASQPDIGAAPSAATPDATVGAVDSTPAAGGAAPAASSGGKHLTTTEWVLIGVGGVALVGLLAAYSKYRAVTAPLRYVKRVTGALKSGLK